MAPPERVRHDPLLRAFEDLRAVSHAREVWPRGSPVYAALLRAEVELVDRNRRLAHGFPGAHDDLPPSSGRPFLGLYAG